MYLFIYTCFKLLILERKTGKRAAGDEMFDTFLFSINTIQIPGRSTQTH